MKRTQTANMKKIVSDAGRCELCGSKRDLQAHHIIPYSLFPSDDEDNIICVCKGCHAKLTPTSLLTKVGLNNARENGKKLGHARGTKLTTKKSVSAKKIILEKSKTFNGNIDDAELIEQIGIARGTFYKYKRELKHACE